VFHILIMFIVFPYILYILRVIGTRFLAYRMIYFSIYGRSKNKKMARKILPNCLGEYEINPVYNVSEVISVIITKKHTHAKKLF
jgi:hypothetical protein